MRIFIFSLLMVCLTACLKDHSELVVSSGKSGQYQYPDYIDGYITISHSWYRACKDSSFNPNSKEFLAGDTIFVTITEVLGPDWQAPEIYLDATAEIVCSNGDREQFVFNFPLPICIATIDGVLPWFSAIRTQRSSSIEKHNHIVEIRNDPVMLIARYRSYWTGNIVTDTAFVSP